MSFFSSLGNLAKKAVGYIAPLTGLIPGVGGTIAGALASAIPQKGAPAPAPPITTAGTGAGGLTQTLPVLAGKGGMTGPGTPTPQGLMGQLGQLGGQFLKAGAQGMGLLPATRGNGGAIATKTGRLTGNLIPRGYIERMSPSGVIYLAKQKRRRGITARDISSFYRVNRLVSKIHGRAHRAPAKRGK